MLPFRVRVNLIPYQCKRSQFQVDSFRSLWYRNQRPVKYDRKVFAELNKVPAIASWIKQPAEHRKLGIVGLFELNYDRFNDHQDVTVPVERTLWKSQTSKKWNVSSFERFEAP